MKTIAVLTDFSGRSSNAALFAIGLAQKISARVLLFNTYIVPADTHIAAQIVWPLERAEDVKKEHELKLANQSAALKSVFEEKYAGNGSTPAIDYQSAEGPLAFTTSKLLADDSILLLVMATHGHDGILGLMMGDNCREVMDHTTKPLLIIPEKVTYHQIGKFAFATDFTYGDVDYINSLASLAKHFSAEIMVTNVNPDEHIDSRHETDVNLFMDKLTSQIDYTRINYRSIPNHNIKKGLEWLIENIKFDVLVMVHRKSNFFDYLFKPSLTKQIAGNIHVPLLVYPFPSTSIPRF